MGPRRLRRGNPTGGRTATLSRTCFNGAAPVKARKRNDGVTVPVRGLGFNGAAPVKARKPAADVLAGEGYISFNGAAPVKARKRERFEGLVRLAFNASMGPRRLRRGNPSAARARTTRRTCFNGAAPVKARKHMGRHSYITHLSASFNGAAPVKARKLTTA